MENILREIQWQILRGRDRPAVSSRDPKTDVAVSWTYGELGSSIAETAAFLRDKKIGSVGILAQKSGEAYASVIASLLCGIPFVPLNPQWPAGRLRDVIEDAGLSVVCTDGHGLPLAQTLGTEIRLVEKSGSAKEFDFVPMDECLTAYVLFTSGSTGRPKGVAVSRGNFRFALDGLESQFPVSAEDRFSQTFDLSFDLSLGEILWALRHGACLCPLSGFDVPFLPRYLERERISIWGSTPSVAKLALAHMKNPQAFTAVRFSLFCGEALPGNLAQRWRGHFPNSVIGNFYGPTETTLYVSAALWKVGEPSFRHDLPLGREFPGTQIALVKDGRVDPSAGEIWIKGPQVATGYLNNPAATAASFVNPDWDPNGRWYRTGDEAIRRDDGDLYFAGRADQQIKLLGQRVDLREIEIRLASASAAQWIAVPERDRSSGVITGVLAVCDRDLTAVDVFAVLKKVRGHLPSAWLPSRVYSIESLPLNSSSKVDRRAIEDLLSAGRLKLTWPTQRSALRRWQDRNSAPDVLKILKPDFASNYFAAIERSGQASYMTMIAADGTSVTKTFAEFHDDVSKTRHRLRERFANDKPVCVISQNSYPFTVFATAILLERMSLCLLNPLEGEERLANKAKAVSPQICLQPELAASYPALAQSALLMQIPKEGERRTERGAPFGEKTFVMIFTSGTTGFSKVVEQLEDGVMVNVDALIERHGLSGRRVIGTPLPLFHVNAFEFSFFCSLLSGSRLVLFERFTPRVLLESIEKFGVEILSLIPDMIRLLTSATWPNLPALRYIVTAAAPLSPDLARAALEKLPVRIIQGYGLSEAVNFSALMPTNLSDKDHAHWLTGYERPSIGTPLRGNDLFVLDETGSEVGEGVTGEIAIRGLNVMKGYLETDNSRVFEGEYLRTGDRGFFRRSAGGEPYFFINGRNKDVIKRAGSTISLVEIDDILGRLPAPMTAIAVGFRRRDGTEDVGVAFHFDASRPDFEAVIEFLEREVPEYMRPRAVLAVTEPVKTASGKPCRWKFKAAFEAAAVPSGKRIAKLGKG